MDQILIPINEIIKKLQLKPNLKEYNCYDEINKGKYIYFAFYNEKIIYIGKSENIKKRLNTHHSGKRSGSQFCVYFFDKYVLNQELSNKLKEIKGNLTPLIDEEIKSKIKEVKFKYLEIGEPKTSLSKIESCSIKEMKNRFPDILNIK